MNVPLGHKLKIMKKIKDLRKDRGMTVPESRQGQRPKQGENVESNVREFKKVDYEELPDPTAGAGTSTQASMGANTGKASTKLGGGKLMQGEYNEEQSHKEFLEALHAWRSFLGPLS